MEKRKYKGQSRNQWNKQNSNTEKFRMGNWSLEISKFDKPSVNQTNQKKLSKRAQITNIRNERGGVTTDSTNVKWIMWKYCENFYQQGQQLRWNNSFKESNFSHLKKIDNMISSISFKEVELTVKNFFIRENPSPDSSPIEFYQSFKEEILPVVCKWENWKGGNLSSPQLIL